MSYYADCPICGEPAEYEPAQVATLWDPALKATLFCINCEWIGDNYDIEKFQLEAGIVE